MIEEREMSKVFMCKLFDRSIVVVDLIHFCLVVVGVGMHAFSKLNSDYVY